MPRGPLFRPPQAVPGHHLGRVVLASVETMNAYCTHAWALVLTLLSLHALLCASVSKDVTMLFYKSSYKNSFTDVCGAHLCLELQHYRTAQRKGNTDFRVGFN